ncbi:MAG: tetratricopeptide repeat protein [Acidobacteriota bacterium]
MGFQTKAVAAVITLLVMTGSLQLARAQDAPDRTRAWLKYIEAQRLAAEGLENRSERSIEVAIEALRETIRLDPEAPDPHLDLANLYLFGKPDPELAEREAREAIRLAPQSPDGYLVLGRLAYLILRRQEELGNSTERPDRYENVIAAYQKVAELDPRQTEAWLILQSIYETGKRFDDQIHALEKFLAAPPIGPENIFVGQLINPPFTEDRAWFKLSLLYLLRGRNEAALTAARRAYESDPESDSYEDNLFEIIGWVSSREEEVRVLRQLFGSAATPRVAIRYADALVRAGREEEALILLRDPAAFAEGGETIPRASISATALRRLNRRNEALTILREAISAIVPATGPANDEDEQIGLRLELAETLEELGRDPEAIAQYESIFDHLLRRGPEVTVSGRNFNLTVERLVRTLRRTGRQTRLQSILARTRRVVDEQNPLLDQIAIQSMTEDGRLEEALRVTRAAARRYREDRFWIFTESSILAQLRRFPESIQLIEGLVVGTPESASEDCDLFLHLAAVYQERGGLDEAAEAARRALRLASTNSYLRDQLTSARLLLGSILHRQGRHDESIAMLREILAEDPVEATALNNLGFFLTEQGRSFDEARRVIERAVAIEPLNGSFLDSLGWVLFKLGETGKARAILERALIYSPRSATAAEHLGEVLLSLGRKVAARRAWEKALEYSADPLQQERLRARLK